MLSVPASSIRTLDHCIVTGVDSHTPTQQVVSCLKRSGFDPIPLRKWGGANNRKAPARQEWQSTTFAPDDWQDGEGVGLRTGLQGNGCYLYVIDLDYKSEQGIDAAHVFEDILQQLPEPLRNRLFLARSTSGQGRYIIFKSRRELPSRNLYNEPHQKIGDFLGPGRYVVVPTPDRWLQGSLADVPLLDDADVDALITAAGYHTNQRDSAEHAGRIDWAEVERYLSNISGLLKRVKPHTLTFKQLHSNGGADRSKTRWMLAHELRKRYGLPDEEIAALLMHFDFGHLRQKGPTWLQADIERCIADANTGYPDVLVNRSRYVQSDAAQPVSNVDRPKRGRPNRLTAEKLYAGLRRIADGYTVMQTEPALAERFKVSVPTIRRRLAELKQQGLVTVEVVRKGRHTYSYVVLSAIKNTSAATELVRSAPAEKARQDAANCMPGVLKEVHTCESTLPPGPVDAPSAAVTLDDAARAVLEVCGSRPCFKRFTEQFETYFPHIQISEGLRRKAYKQALATRRRERTTNKETTKVRAATPTELRRMARAYAWKHTDARQRGHEKQAFMWDAKAQLVEEEIERRQEIGEWSSTRGCRNAPASARLRPIVGPATDDGALAESCVPPQQPMAVVSPKMWSPTLALDLD